MSGLKSKIKDKKSLKFNENLKRTIVEDYLQSGLTKREIWEKYTGRPSEHGKILEWMRKYGYTTGSKVKSFTFASQILPMSQENNNKELSHFEVIHLQKYNSELEKQLRDSQQQSLAWQTMIELAEKEFNISIKKKFNTKSSKK